MPLTSPVKVALIGCGAVSERLHVPAILARRDVQVTAAVDKNQERAALVAAMTGARPFSSIADALPHFDAAIVGLPHNLHAPATVELLTAGKHVLVEKPMANTAAECDAMIAAGRKSGATLGVGQARRFCPAVAAAKELLDAGVLGSLRRFEILEGNIYDWPIASDFFFRKETAGGGVLLDTGAHTFDMLLWFFGEVAALDYRDDSYGGVEADCEVRMKMASGAEGYVELSRTRNLPTELLVEGERGRMTVSYVRNEIALHLNGRKLDPLAGKTLDPRGRQVSIWDLMIIRQLENWVLSLLGGAPFIVPGEEGRRAVAFIERCYNQRQLLTLPWVELEGVRA